LRHGVVGSLVLLLLKLYPYSLEYHPFLASVFSTVLLCAWKCMYGRTAIIHNFGDVSAANVQETAECLYRITLSGQS